jgi:hypothetical protein
LTARSSGGWVGALGAGVPRRDREAQYVGERARIPVGHRSGQTCDLWCQHRFSADHRRQTRQSPIVVACCHPVDHIPVDELPGEANPHPGTGTRGLTLGIGDRVVEEPVEVRQ